MLAPRRSLLGLALLGVAGSNCLPQPPESAWSALALACAERELALRALDDHGLVLAESAERGCPDTGIHEAADLDSAPGSLVESDGGIDTRLAFVPVDGEGRPLHPGQRFARLVDAPLETGTPVMVTATALGDAEGGVRSAWSARVQWSFDLAWPASERRPVRIALAVLHQPVDEPSGVRLAAVRLLPPDGGAAVPIATVSLPVDARPSVRLELAGGRGYRLEGLLEGELGTPSGEPDRVPPLYVHQLQAEVAVAEAAAP